MFWKNSNFQIQHFIVGKCFTPDEAYRVLQELKLDRELAIEEFKAYDLETTEKLKGLDLNTHLNSTGLSRAESLRLSSQHKHAKECYLQAVNELQFIESLIVKIDPHREFKHLPDAEAHQACQRLEWKLKLENKLKLSMSTQGMISPDLLETIQAHPDCNYLLDVMDRIIQNPKNSQIGQSQLLLLLGE